MIERALRIEVDGGEVAGVLARSDACRPHVTPGLVLAHGANNDLGHPLLVAVATHLAQTGAASVLRFNFPYAERGASTPDRPAVLEAAFRRARDVLVDDEVCPPGSVFLGGKSLGARVAAELVSSDLERAGSPSAGLVFLGYPLHAPGRKDRLRLEPLRHIEVPSLFVEGTRDPFCDLDLLRPVITALGGPGTLYTVNGGGHSFEVPRSSGRTPEDVYGNVAREVARFITEHADPRHAPTSARGGA